MIGHDLEDRQLPAILKLVHSRLIKRLSRVAKRIVHPDFLITRNIIAKIGQRHLGRIPSRRIGTNVIFSLCIIEPKRVRFVLGFETKRDSILFAINFNQIRTRLTNVLGNQIGTHFFAIGF